jgi:hypothetical protein
MVLQGAWVTCTKEHSTSDHPGNTLPLCRPMNEALMQQPKNPAHSWRADYFFQDWHKFPIEWYHPYKVTSYINKKFNIIPYKMSGTNPAKISNCILILAYGYILYDSSDFMPTVNHPFYFGPSNGVWPLEKSEMLQNGWLQESDFQQNDPIFGALYGPGGYPFQRGSSTGIRKTIHDNSRKWIHKDI